MVELKVRVDVPVPPEERVTLAGLTEDVRPDGDTADVRATVPAKPLTLVRVIVCVLTRPAMTLTLDGALRVKSTTFTVTMAERDRDPLVPCTVTV